jgi:hypothetical protein
MTESKKRLRAFDILSPPTWICQRPRSGFQYALFNFSIRADSRNSRMSGWIAADERAISVGQHTPAVNPIFGLLTPFRSHSV